MKNIVEALINLKNRIYLIGHINTDYDSICSCLSMAYCLQKLNKDVKILLTEDAKVLLRNANITISNPIFESEIPQEKENYSAILMDMNTTKRAGSYEEFYLNAKVKINIDHHHNNKIIADAKFVDQNAGANCENIFKIIQQIEKEKDVKILNREICYLLSIGIITDTCNLSSSTNMEQTKNIIHILQENNVNIKEVAQKYYLTLTSKQEKLLNLALKSMEKIQNVSYYGVDCSKLKEKFIHNDFAIVLNQITNKDKNTYILFEQKFNGYSVWEFRSSNGKHFPVNEIATSIGGGGHAHASGATVYNCNKDDVINLFLQQNSLTK